MTKLVRAIFPVPLLPCPVTAAYCGVSFPVGASSLTGPIAVLVCLHFSWQVGSLLISSSSTSSQSLGFWIEKPLPNKSVLQIMNLSSTLCNLLWWLVIQLNSGDCVSWYSSSWLKSGWLSPIRYGCLLSGRSYCDRVWALPYPQEGKKGDAF